MTEEKNDEKRRSFIPRPDEIVSYLDEHVIGQDDAKRTLAAAVFNHYKRVLANLHGASPSPEWDDVVIDKSNVLLAGHTGTGKTYMIKKIAEMVGIPCYVADATKITESGYVGDDVETILVGLLQQCNYNVEMAEMGCLILDEIDKIGRKSDNPSITRDVGGEGVQQGLLKMVEGCVVGVPPNGGRKHPEQQLIYVDTTNILFIGMGAFDGLDRIVERRLNRKTVGFNSDEKTEAEDYNPLSEVTPDDLRKFGMIPELIGRFPVVTYTNDLTVEDMRRILTEPKSSIVKQYKKLFLIDGVELEFTDDAIERIAEMTMALGIGARGLRTIMERLMVDLTFDCKRGDRFVVDKAYVERTSKKKDAA